MDGILQPSRVLSSTKSVTVFSITIVFLITSTVSVILRLVAKRLNKQKLAVEDFLILAAQFLVIGMGTAVILAVFLGSLGHHTDTIPASHLTAYLKILVTLQLFYGSTLGLIKTSICFFYIRIFFTRRFRIAAYTVIAFITMWSIMAILTGFLICIPIAFNWDPTIKNGRCANMNATFVAVGVLDLLVDCAVFALPIPMIWNLKISRGNKIALFGIFGLGISTMVTSCLRIQSLVTVEFSDITFTAVYPAIWSFLEPAIGITVACGPLLRPLFKQNRVATRFKRTGDSTKGSGSATFERLEEPAHPLIDYPPSTLQTTVTARAVSGPGSTYLREEDGVSENRQVDERMIGSNPGWETGGIRVKREWNMQTE